MIRGGSLIFWRKKGAGSSVKWLQGKPLNPGSNNMSPKIVRVSVRDVRFPTSLEQHGSDAMVWTSWRGGEVLVLLLLWGSFRPSFPLSVRSPAHRPGLFRRLRGSGNGRWTERIRPHIHVRKRHRNRWEKAPLNAAKPAQNRSLCRYNSANFVMRSKAF